MSKTLSEETSAETLRRAFAVRAHTPPAEQLTVHTAPSALEIQRHLEPFNVKLDHLTANLSRLQAELDQLTTRVRQQVAQRAALAPPSMPVAAIVPRPLTPVTSPAPLIPVAQPVVVPSPVMPRTDQSAARKAITPPRRGARLMTVVTGLLLSAAAVFAYMEWRQFVSVQPQASEQPPPVDESAEPRATSAEAERTRS